jgi:hypothetical protein
MGVAIDPIDPQACLARGRDGRLRQELTAGVTKPQPVKRQV